MAPRQHQKLAYSVEEAADLLSISRAQIYRLLDLLEIGSLTMGQSRRITAGQIDAFIKVREQMRARTDERARRVFDRRS
jgi:excisionase family DNA binding protein